MSNKEKYEQAFIKTLEVEPEQLKQDLSYNSIPQWDSIGHMSLIAALEETYNIMMDTDDIIEFSSFNKGIEILEKYEVKVS